MLRLALPSKGELEEPTLAFLESCGLEVARPNERQYTALLPNLPGSLVLFQRAADIAGKVEGGSAELGITGLDTVCEYQRDGSDLIVILEDLGYSRCELLLAVPDSWIDVSSLADLADLASEFRERGRELRVATRFPHLTQDFLFHRGIHHFILVESTGATEAAPTMGYAEIIADLSASGTTLRENRLKTIEGGTILSSQACLIGNKRLLREGSSQLEITRNLLELMEARLRAQGYYSVTANIKGESAQAVAEHVLRQPEVAGLQGPTVAKVYSRQAAEQDWYAVTVVVGTERVLKAVEHLRQMGGSGITVFSPKYVFEGESQAYRKLLEELKPLKVRRARAAVT